MNKTDNETQAAAGSAAAVAEGQGKIISIDEGRIREHLSGLVLEAVEETLNALLNAEADALCGAQRYERSAERVDTRAGSYERGLHTKAGEVKLKVPKLRKRLARPPSPSCPLRLLGPLRRRSSSGISGRKAVWRRHSSRCI